MMSLLRSLGEEAGQDIAEYAVMLAVILAVVVGTIRLIGSNANPGRPRRPYFFQFAPVGLPLPPAGHGVAVSIWQPEPWKAALAHPDVASRPRCTRAAPQRTFAFF